MLTKKVAALVAGTGMAGLLAGCGTGTMFGATSSEKASHEITQKVTSLKVDSDSGDVAIVAGSGPGVKISEELHFSGDEKPVTSRKVDSGALTVGYECPSGGLLGKSCSVDFRIEVPKNLAVAVDAGSGGIEASGVGRANLTASSGDVTVKGVAGNLTVNADSGSITAENVTGTAKLEAGSGDIDAIRIGGGLQANAGSGSVAGRELAGKTITVDASSGDVELATTTRPTAIDVNADSGSVTLRLPDGGYNVDASTDSGSKTVEVDTVSTPGHSIKVRASSGDIDIKKA